MEGKNSLLGYTIQKNKKWLIKYSDQFDDQAKERALNLDRAHDLLAALIEDVLFVDKSIAEHVCYRSKLPEFGLRTRVQLIDRQENISLILEVMPEKREVLGVTIINHSLPGCNITRKTKCVCLDLSEFVESDGEITANLRLFDFDLGAWRFKKIAQQEIDASALSFPEGDYKEEK